ncbi:putative peptidase [Rhodococcus aetherivorans]|uniref:Peptidase n=1 Tax=Rhodococcus aetherivorans TaxID=191292 RepID=A0ABQ0YI07_9NOCA|nr:putative peptidase [Rhodococcus aetherivorans]
MWGGGNVNGPSGGGFDCSGLTSYAVYAATGVRLPRTSQTQWRVGTEIPIQLARPGDLVFGNWQSDGPGHVGIYIGGGQMVHAPTFGDVVRVGAVFPGMKARRLL